MIGIPKSVSSPVASAGADRPPAIRSRRRRLIGAWLAACVGLGLMACSRSEADVVGVWRATVLNKAGEEVAFKLEITRDGDRVVGALVNGDERVTSTSGSFDGRTLRLGYDFYDGALTAQLTGGDLHGSFDRQYRKESLRRQFQARRESRGLSPAAAPGGNLSGEWLLRVGEGEGQKTWRASLRQKGGEVSGTIIPLSGDWGTLTGTFERGQLTLSRFDGINAYLFKARLTEQGKLEGLLNSERKVVAERAESAGSLGLSSLPDASTFTKVKNPAEPFRFSFPDLDGKTVSSTDERFRHKVVIVTITGSWCPNCHDEAPVLNDLYGRYRAQGLEVVGLSFEYTGDEARDREQVRIFARRHGLRYPMLLAGTTDEGEVERKLPQLANFGAFPTTIFVGRDGLVKKIHAGFEGPATGERFTRLKAELEEVIKELLGAAGGDEPTPAGQ